MLQIKKNNYVFKFLYTVSLAFFILQSASIVIIGQDINYQFLSNLFILDNYTVALTTYIWYSLVFLFGLCLSVIIFNYLFQKINIISLKEKLLFLSLKIENKCFVISIQKYVNIILILYSIGFLCSSHSLTYRFVNNALFKTFFNRIKYKTSKEIFEEITGNNYISKSKIKARFIDQDAKPKNLVIIILESIEQNFLDNQRFPNIATNISKLFNDPNNEVYYNIDQITGSENTIAMKHTMFTGIPRIYNFNNKSVNDPIFNKYKNSRVLFTNILKKLGYIQFYLQGAKKEFAGTNYFFANGEFDYIYGKKEILKEYNIDKSNLSGWGVKDIDLFEFAKIKYSELSKSNKPFVFVMENLATHLPNGIEDKRCENNDNLSDYLNTLKCFDYYFNDFMNFLKSQDNYKDTIILVLPDHLIYNSYIVKQLGNPQDRKLYSIFLNTKESGKRYDNTIIYPELPRIILDKLGVETNFNFMMDNFKNRTNKEKIKFLNDNFYNIKQFNENSLFQ